jgi:hypothetical protein
MPASRRSLAAGRRCRCARPWCRRCSQFVAVRRQASSGRPQRRGIASSGFLQMQRQLLLAELLHQLGLVLDQDDLALVDDADAVGHLLGFLDVVRGQDDGDAGGAQRRAPSPTCRLRNSTSTPAVGSSRNRICGSCDSALAIITRRFMPPDSVMILAVLLVPQRQVLQHLLDIGRIFGLPNRPRLKLTVAHTVSNASVVQFLRHQADQRARGAVVATMSWPSRDAALARD